jgi:RNA polymerase sigma-70 factor (ECF subfamily)
MTPSSQRFDPTRRAPEFLDPGASGDLVLPAIARGERLAVSRCVDRFGPLVWSISRRLSPTRQDAEDAVQEIFLDLWRSADRFDPRVGSETVFVTIVARRRLIDRLRRLRAHRVLEPLGEEAMANLPWQDDLSEQSAEAQIARTALEQLPIEQRRVIDLSVVHGLSHSEIAERTGLPLGTVKTTIRRGLVKVRQALQVLARPAANAAGER